MIVLKRVLFQKIKEKGIYKVHMLIKAMYTIVMDTISCIYNSHALMILDIKLFCRQSVEILQSSVNKSVRT